MAPKKRKTTQFDKSRFLSAENEEWCEKRMNFPFIVERTVEADTITTLGLNTLWSKIGWEKVLTELKTSYSPELVREFYANIKGREKKEDRNPIYIESWVRGKRVMISRTDINEHFGITQKSAKMYFGINDFRVVKGNYVLPDYDTFADKLGAKVSYIHSSTGKKPEPFVNRDFLPPHLFVSTEVMARNVFPKKSNIKRLRLYDAFILSGMVKEQPDEIDWYDYGSCVYDGIWNSATHNVDSKGIYFPILISQLLRKRSVELVNPVTPDAECTLTIAGLFNIHKQFYQYMNREWINIAREIHHKQWDIEQQQPCTPAEFVRPTKAQLKRLRIIKVFKDEEEDEAAMGASMSAGAGSSSGAPRRRRAENFGEMTELMEYNQDYTTYQLGSYHHMGMQNLSNYFDSVHIGDYQFPHMPVPPHPEPPMAPFWYTPPPHWHVPPPPPPPQQDLGVDDVDEAYDAMDD